MARIIPLTGTDNQREIIAAAELLLPNELHSTNDTQRLFLQNSHIGPSLYHGQVANEAARLGLNASSARGCLPNDSCFQIDNSTLYICKSNKGGLAGDWDAVTFAFLSDVTTTEGDLLVRGASAVERLPIGSSGQALIVVAGVPAWGAITPLTTLGDLLYRDGSGLQRLPIGSDGQVLKIVAGVPVWDTDATGGGGGGAIEPQNLWEEYDDLVGYNQAAGFTTYSTGGSTVLWAAGSPGHPGVAEITSLASTAASCGILKTSSPSTVTEQIFLGGGEIIFDALVEIPTLWGGANTGSIRIGLMDEISGAPTNAIQAQYDPSPATWRLAARNAGSVTFVDGPTTVVTGWHHIRIVIEETAASAELFVNGVSQGSVSTNIPTEGMSYGIQVQKTASTVPAICRVDLLHIKQTFTTPRY